MRREPVLIINFYFSYTSVFFFCDISLLNSSHLCNDVLTQICVQLTTTEELADHSPLPQSLMARIANLYVTRGLSSGDLKAKPEVDPITFLGAFSQKEPSSQATSYVTNWFSGD